ncbi:FecCD family ABC transporter permease [Marisediminicola sp. LYQ134]|uniref:FecCD family ABC transporter permease n=1 Tax=Marisediminicola sp. LYQ134 TaxID=3391061 RepID=UPI0039838136
MMPSSTRSGAELPAPSTTAVAPAGRRRALSPLLLGLVVAIVVTLGCVALSLAVGTRAIALADVWTALVAPTGTFDDTVVASRIPRTLLAVLVGSALAVSGVVMQGVTRNPLGDPGLLGVNVGAAAAIVTAAWFFGTGSAAASVWVALPGAFVTVVIVYALGSGRRAASPVRLVLAGAVVSAVIAAYIQALSLSRPDVFDSYRYWVVGSLAGREPAVVGEILPFILVGLAFAFLIAPALNTLALGDDTATALGASTGRTRVLGAVATTLLCAASTAAVGPIGFVGLAVPHIVRSFTGSDHRWVMLYSAILGPALVLLADVIARVIVSPAELMVGVVTAFIGAPVLLYAVRRGRGFA